MLYTVTYNIVHKLYFNKKRDVTADTAGFKRQNNTIDG